MFTLLLIVGIFVLMRTMNSQPIPQEGEQGSGPANSGKYDPMDNVQRPKQGSSTKAPDDGGWEMDSDIPAAKSDQAKSKPSTKSSSDDWSMESVPTKNKTKPNDNGFEMDTNVIKKKPSPPKSTRKGDWELEEVPSKKDN